MRNLFNFWRCCQPSIVLYRRRPYDAYDHYFNFVIHDRTDLAWERQMARLPWQIGGFR
jgi:hypothetical protein